MLQPNLVAIEAISSDQWFDLMPLITMGLFSLLSLLCAPNKGRWQHSAVVMLLIGTALAMGFLHQQQTENILSGIFVFDPLSRFFSMIILFSMAATALVSIDYVKKEPLLAETYPLLGFAATALMIMVSSRDLFIIFIGLEIASLSIYVLVGGQRYVKASAEAALKYYLLGGAASAVFLYGISLYYGITGTTSFVSIAADHASLSMLAILLLLAGFIFKIGGFPLHFWVPDVYSGACLPIAGFMISAVKAASVGAFLRFALEVIRPMQADGSHEIFYWLMAVVVTGSMLYGAIMGLMQANIKRLLAYSSIANSGFIALGILTVMAGGGEWRAFGAVTAYTLFYVITSIGVFAVLSMIAPKHHDNLELKDLAGLAKVRPKASFALMVLFASMAGLPPTAGFIGKYRIFSVSLSADQSELVLIGLLASVLSIAFYLRPIVAMYMTTPMGAMHESDNRSGFLVATIGLGLTVVFGIFPTWISFFFP